MIYDKPYLNQVVTDKEKEDFLNNVIALLNAASNPDWKTPIKQSEDKAYRVYLTKYPNIYLIITTCKINKVGIEVKMCMRAAQRLSLFDMQGIIDTIQRVVKITEAKAVIYKD